MVATGLVQYLDHTFLCVKHSNPAIQYDQPLGNIVDLRVDKFWLTVERDHMKLGLSEGRISNGPVSNIRALALAIFQTIQNLDSNLLQLLQCSPTFSRTHPPSFPPRTFSQQTPGKLTAVTHVCTFKTACKMPLLDQFPQKTNMYRQSLVK